MLFLVPQCLFVFCFCSWGGKAVPKKNHSILKMMQETTSALMMRKAVEKTTIRLVLTWINLSVFDGWIHNVWLYLKQNIDSQATCYLMLLDFIYLFIYIPVKSWLQCSSIMYKSVFFLTSFCIISIFEALWNTCYGVP